MKESKRLSIDRVPESRKKTVKKVKEKRRKKKNIILAQTLEPGCLIKFKDILTFFNNDIEMQHMKYIPCFSKNHCSYSTAVGFIIQSLKWLGQF